MKGGSGMVITMKPQRTSTRFPTPMIAFLSLVLVFGLLGCSSIVKSKQPDPDWVDSYASVEEMAEASDVIILAEVAKQTTQIRTDVVFTMSESKILKTYKPSDKPYSKIEVLQTGGKSGNLVTDPIEGVLMLQKDKTYLLFLKETDEGHYLIMGGIQGAAWVFDQFIYFPDNNAFEDNPLDRLSIDQIESVLSNKLAK